MPRDPSMHRCWVLKISRKDWKPTNYTRVCSEHFVGKNGPTKENPIPTIFPHRPEVQTKHRAPPKDRSTPTMTTGTTTSVDRPTVELECIDVSKHAAETMWMHDYGTRQTCIPTEPESLHEDTNTKTTQTQTDTRDMDVQATCETRDIGIQVDLPTLPVEDLKHKDSEVTFYTGFANFVTMMALFSTILPMAQNMKYWRGADSCNKKSYEKENGNLNQKKPGKQRKLRLIDEFLLVFMRLRLGLSVNDLAYRFRISASHTSRIFITWINLLYTCMQPMVT